VNRTPVGHFRALARLLALVAALTGCQSGTESSVDPGSLLAAAGGGGKPSNGPTVTAVSPAHAHKGEAGVQVTITGSGFTPGAQAAWERGGVADPGIQVLGTQYISPTQLVATISVGTEADVALYDISVTALDRKKGIGFALFEVTQAFVAEGSYPLRASNDAGQMAGGGAGTITFNPTTGLEVLDPTGEGWAVDQTGTAIVGGAAPRLWNKVGGSWQLTLLPTGTSSAGGRASSLVADPSGQALLIGGLEFVPTGKRTTSQQPRLWVWQASTSQWSRVLLPTGSATKGDVLGVSDNGVVAGWVGAFQAAVWESDGSGYLMTPLAPAGSRAMGINSAGTLIVGASGGVAVYWERLSGGGWSAPITLPGGCTLARDVDDLGRIVANDCPNGTRTGPVALVPPYSAGTMIRLSGLGPSSAGYVEGISPSGSYIVGQAGGVGVYWRIF
jgi:hypothetical protein